MKTDRYDNTGYENLANAIIVQAVVDYRKELDILEKRPRDLNAQAHKKKLERFFRSEYFRILSNIDPEYLMWRVQNTPLSEIRGKSSNYTRSNMFHEERTMDDLW